MTNESPKKPVLTRFVAFYSYKGGVGRTLALANCARVLAASGKKVVLLDLDLEAPGLLHFDAFLPKSKDKNPAGFAEYLEVCLQKGPPQTLDDFVHACKGKPNDKGKTWLMPAGRHGESGYLAFLNDKTWNDFYSQQDGYKILENLRGHIIAQYQPDYVLIDSRTGLSEIGGIATHQLADIVVLVFNLNQQNLVGAKRVFDSIRQKAPLQPDIILTASPVPVMPVSKGSPFAEKMQRIGRDFKGAYNADKPLLIPYHPLLAYDDRLLVDDGDLFSSDTPYRRLAETIQNVAQVDVVPYLRQMAEPMQKGDWQQVMEIAQRGLAKNPTSFALLRNLSSAYYFTGSLEKAIAATDEALRVSGEASDIEKALLLFNKGVTLDQLKKPEAEIAVYDELLRRFGDASELALQEQVAQALVNKGITLGQMEQPEAEITVYDELLGRFGDASELALQEQVAQALFNKGITLGQMEQPEAAMAAYDELLRRFGDAPELALQERVANALVNKGVTLRQLEKPEAAVAAYDELLRRFGDASELALQEPVAKALVNKGVTLGRMEKPEAAVAAYDELLRRFGDAPELALQERVANALVNKGVTLRQLEKPEAAVAAYDELLRRFGDAPELALQEPVAKALVNKGVTLGRMEQPEAAMAAYDELLRRFGDSQALALQEQVAKALNSKGFTMLISAKRRTEKVQRDELLQSALASFEKVALIAIERDKAMALGNQAYTLFLLDRKIEAQPILLEALRLGGQDLYDDETEDSCMHELPEDAEFRMLLDQLWAQVKPESDK
ncbi:MAG: tetratricopeptide repeat protein [Methylomonas lenta]|nr:tetratricopeptide repeat protein [Methylomonas lenta]